MPVQSSTRISVQASTGRNRDKCRCLIAAVAALAVSLVLLAVPSELSAQAPRFGIQTQRMTELDKATALEATIKALGANGSDAAIEILKAIVVGKLEFGRHTRLAVQLSLQELVKVESEPVEELLVQAVVEPGNVRVGNRNRYGLAPLKNDVKRLLAEHASARVRALLAEHYNRGMFRGAERAEIEELLQTVHVTNVAGQATLLGGGRAATALKQELRGYLSTYNDFAAKSLFGFPRRWTPPVPSGDFSQSEQTPPASGPPDPVEIASILWTGDFLDAVLRSAAGAENRFAELAPLLGAIPTEGARVRLVDLLKEAWTEGPGIFLADGQGAATPAANPITSVPPVATPAPTRRGPRRRRRGDDDEEDEYTVRTPRRPIPRASRGPQANGSDDAPAEWKAGDGQRFAGLWVDPGVLVVLKHIPYQQAPRNYRPEPYSNEDRGEVRPRVKALLEARAARRRELELKYQWFNAIAAYVRALNKRCAAAAGSDANSYMSEVNDTSDAGGSDSEQKSQGLPFPLHEGANIVTGYDLNWPSTLDPRLGEIVSSPFRVRYFQLQQIGGYAKTQRHYRNALPDKTHDWRAGEGVWLDSTQDGSSPDTVQSIDVLIERETRDDALTVRTTADDDVVTVHILVVEIPRSHLGQ